jgi:hypothetical protein
MKIKRTSLCAATALTLALSPALQATQYTINNAPTIPDSHSVQFFYLESPFPFNTPQSIVDAAGSNYRSYGIGHAGLGVWDTTEGTKYTIELVSESYVGSLLPTVSGNDLVWNNAGKIVISSPLDDDLWLNARLIATTSGNAFTQLITYLQDDIGSTFQYYQPVTALYINASLVNTSLGDVTNSNINEIGSITLAPVNSFSFVDALIYQLGTFGIDLGAFLSIYATSFNYFTLPDTVLQVVASNNVDVLQWYSALSQCYSTMFNNIVQPGDGAQVFLQEIKNCYGSYAYVFASPSTVYNITLANVTEYYGTPFQAQYVYNLPDNNTGKALRLTMAEYVIIAFCAVATLIAVALFFYRFTCKKIRRRISMEGSRFAERAVENIVESNEDHEYFHGKQYGNTFFGRMGATFSRGGSPSKYPRPSDSTAGEIESNPLR